MNRRTFVLLAGLLLLITVIVWIWERSEDPDPVVRQAVAPTRLTALARPGIRSPVPIRKVEIELPAREESEFDPYAEWSTAAILGAFGIPPGEFNGATLEEVVGYLEEVFEENGGRGVQFRIEGGGGFPVTCDFGNVSASGLMGLVAGLSGYDLVIGDGEVVFRRKPEPDHDTVVRLEVSKDQYLASDGESLRVSFEKFAEYGIELDAELGMEVDEETGMIAVTGAPDQIERASAVLDFIQPTAALGLVSIHTKMLSVDDAVVEEREAQVFADGEVAAGSIARGDLVSMPSIITSAGQEAKMESIREIYVPSEGGGQELVNVGFSLRFAPVVLGLDRFDLGSTIEYSSVDESALERAPNEDGSGEVMRVQSADDIRVDSTLVEGQMFDGSTARFLAGEEDGASTIQLMTLRRLGADGKPLFTQAD